METKVLTSAKQLTLDDRKNIITDFLSGLKYAPLAKKYNTTPKTIKDIIHNDPITRTETERELLDAHIAFETTKIRQIKGLFFKYTELALKDAMPDDPDASPNFQRLHHMSKARDMLAKIDEMERLNDQRETSITRTTNVNQNFDMSEVMKGLKTSKDKKRFLLAQSTK